MGIAYSALGNYGKGIDYQEQSLAIARETKDRTGEGTALSNLGNAYQSLGNYDKAITYYEQHLAITREIKDRQGEGKALGSLGYAYQSLGNYGKAITYQEQHLAIAREIKDQQGEGYALSDLGFVYYNMGNYGKAIIYQEQALAILRKIKDRLGEGQSLDYLGIAYSALGNYSKAITYQEQALVIVREIKSRNAEGTTLGNLGNAYYALGNYSKAITYQEKRLAIAREVKDRLGEGQSLSNLGLALFKSGNLAVAAKTLMEGIVTWELLRQSGSGNDANKVLMFETQSLTYRVLQQVLITQNQPNAALEIAERGRARALVELLVKRATDSKVEVPDKSNPAPNLEQIQQIAQNQNATLIEYSILYDEFKIDGKQQGKESALYIWVIPPTGQITFRSVDLKPLQQKQKLSLAELVAQSREAIGARGRSDIEVALSPELLKQRQAEQNRNLKRLHQLLIEPIADLLPTDPNAHVIFMPQSTLFLVPFAALQDKTNQYLIQQHTISIAPAIQVLGLTHQQRQTLPPATNILVAGNPIMPRITLPGADQPLELPDLPGAQQEAIAVAKAFSTKALTGKQATKQAIVQQMQNARIIHLATHGLLDDFKGLGVPGAIALAPDGNGQPNDGLLTADDILGMKLKAELVVLSACNTGQGRLTGDGVIGLSRSLISAGVPSVVVSLWSVPDAPTASLMTQFYQNLQHTPNKAQALRQAMLSTMKDHPNPIDWAAFTLIGEP